jgi:hypothetical protein
MLKWFSRKDDPRLEEALAIIGAKQLKIESLEIRLRRLGNYAAAVEVGYPMLPTPDAERLELHTFRDLWDRMLSCVVEDEDGRETPYLAISEDFYGECFYYCYVTLITLSGQQLDRHDVIFPEYYMDFIALYCDNRHQLG